MTLQLLNITKHYKNGRKKQSIFDGITICFPTYGMVGIIGSSGTGKSTLLNIIGAIERADQGKITIDNEVLYDSSALSINAYRKEYISFVYQYYNMVEALSIKENLLLYATIKQREKDKVLLHMETLIKDFQIESLLLKHPSQLSGGQLQRVALIRAFISETPILLADEPTGALNEEQAILVMEALKKHARKHLVIVVSHEVEVLQGYTNMIVDLDRKNPQYDFSNRNRYFKYNNSFLPMKNGIRLHFYMYRQLLQAKNKLLMILGSQIFTIVAFVVLVCAGVGVQDYFSTIYKQMPTKNIVVLQKNDYTKPIIDIKEVELLKEEKAVAHIEYLYDIAMGDLKYNDESVDCSYQMLPNNKEHIDMIEGKLPTKTNEVCINEVFSKKLEIAIGQNIAYSFDNTIYTYQVVGIIADTLSDYNTLYFDLQHIDSELAKSICITTQVHIEIKSNHSIDTYLQSINNSTYYAYSNYLDTVNSYHSIEQLAILVGTVFMIVSFIISIILLSIVLSTMFIERRKDSSILLANGLSRRRLLLLGVQESLVIGVMISVLGSCIAYGVIFFINGNNLFFHITNIDTLLIVPNRNFSLFMSIIVLYLFVCFLLSLSSTRRIVKMNISTVLKEE